MYQSCSVLTEINKGKQNKVLSIPAGTRGGCRRTLEEFPHAVSATLTLLETSSMHRRLSKEDWFMFVLVGMVLELTVDLDVKQLQLE